MTNFKTFLAILIAVAVLVFVAIMIAPKSTSNTEDTKGMTEISEVLDTSNAQSDTDAPAEEETISDNSIVAEAESSNTDTEATEVVTTIDMGNGPESFVLETADTDIPAYLDVITTEDIQSIKDFLAAQPDIDGDAVKNFWQKYGGNNGYFKVLQDDNSNYLVAAGDEMFMQTDLVRPMKSVDMGLNKTQIDDAFAFPFELTEEQVSKVLKLGVGQKGDFSDAEIEKLKIQLFQFLFSHPHALEAYIELLNQQKIADEFYLNEYWVLGNEYLERCKTAREEGKGMNIWYAKYVNDDDGKEYHFTTEDYHKYVIGLFNLLWPRKAEVAVYTAKAKDHYHLMDLGDFNSMRKATLADYDENLASLVFPFYTKTGKIAIRFGANIRDKRPEILNYTVVKKPVVRQKAVTPVPTQVITPPIIFGVTTTTTTTPPPSGDTPGNPPPDNPPPGDTEHKSPAEGTKAQTGGGQKSDPGPGEQKPDQGNGNGQYQQGTSENPDGSDQKQYDPGPKADNTDNGKAPETEPIETHTSVTENGPSGGNGGGAGGDNSKEIAPPPAED
ncbi:hypothetical protein IKG12_00990 [Candidatus Saccharibacteria bacterium]|nr:hypothetical protein [Candidatus Saccharibacteria bacterium]